MGANLLPSDDLGSNLGSLSSKWKDVFVEALKNGTEEVLVADLVNIIQSQYRTDVANPAYSEGLVFYDNVKKALSYYNDSADTTVNIGQELLAKVYNNTGSTITNGQVVRVAGNAISGVPTVILSQADSVANSGVLGVATNDILDDNIGYVTVWGTVGGYDTSTFLAGDFLFLSTDVAGTLTDVEQPILKPVAVVLDSAVDGTILVGQRPLADVTAIGQAAGANRTQTLSTSPAPVTAYEANIFEKNTVVTQTGTTNFTAQISPASIGASGYYRVSFNVSLTSAVNALFTFEVYKNGISTGLLCVVDLRNNNVNAASASLNAISQNIVLDPDNIEIVGYTDGGTAAVTYTNAVFNIERIGTS